MTGPTLLRNIQEWFSLGMCRLDFSTSWCTSSGFALMDDFATVESTCLCFVLLLDGSFVDKCYRCVVLDFTRLAPQSWSMRGVRMCHRSVLWIQEGPRRSILGSTRLASESLKFARGYNVSHTSALGRRGSLTSKLACDIAVLEEQSDLGPLFLLQRC